MNPAINIVYDLGKELLFFPATRQVFMDGEAIPLTDLSDDLQTTIIDAVLRMRRDIHQYIIQRGKS